MKQKMVDKWSIKPSLAEKLVDILEFVFVYVGWRSVFLGCETGKSLFHYLLKYRHKLFENYTFPS